MLINVNVLLPMHFDSIIYLLLFNHYPLKLWDRNLFAIWVGLCIFKKYGRGIIIILKYFIIDKDKLTKNNTLDWFNISTLNVYLFIYFRIISSFTKLSYSKSCNHLINILFYRPKVIGIVGRYAETTKTSSGSRAAVLCLYNVQPFQMNVCMFSLFMRTPNIYSAIGYAYVLVLAPSIMYPYKKINFNIWVLVGPF